ncbi:MAG: S8 family serine peptidase [Capsulimonadales bacterium]|nr:S8 family serine peptidase [Capsulimonadales bacterium]
MKQRSILKRPLWRFAFSFLLFGLPLLLLPIRGAWADGIVPGYVLARVRDGASISDVIKAINGDDDDDAEDTLILEQVPNTNIYALRLPAGTTETRFANRLRTIPAIQHAEPDTFFGDPKTLPFERKPSPIAENRNVSDYISQGASILELQAAGVVTEAYVHQVAYRQVRLGAVHSLATGEGIKVAVLDTGVNPEHPALYGRCTQGFNAINKDLPPLDMPDGVTNYSVGHGTMVAGMVARIAPQADIVPVRVLNGDGWGSGLNVIKGIVFSQSEGCRVINLSLSSATRLRIMDESIAQAISQGILIVTSAGNDGVNQPRWPAAYPGVMAVASLDTNGQRSPFSNYGSYISVCAPGNGIHGPFHTGGYALWSGTSFAAPFVAGQAALMFSRNASLTGATVRAYIRNTARSVAAANPNSAGLLGAGLIDIERAVRNTPR